MFQQQVFIYPAQGVPGDFASSNPMTYKLSASGKMVADANGVTVGKFAVLNGGANSGTVTSVPGAAPAHKSQIGFVHRESNAQITTFLAEAGNTIATGQPVSLFSNGDFFVNADVVTGTPQRGAEIYWDTLTGNTIVGVPASPPATTVDTGYYLVSDAAAVGATVTISTNA